MPVTFRLGTYRRRHPRATLAEVAPLAARCGVTRLADVTGLDTVGIPVFQAIRPLARSISVSQGKGVTRDAARVSALMEAIELHHAEIIRPDCHGPTRADDCGADDCAADDCKPAIDWCRGTDLLSGRQTRVPHGRVAMDYTRAPPSGVRASSNGVASGNDRTEAIVAGLCEVIERDAQSRWLGLSAVMRHRRAIDADTISAPVGVRLLRLVRAAGLGCCLWSFGEAHGVAAIACAIFETTPGPALVLPPTMGAGAHLEPAVALTRAITEAVQMRATLIAGARDDLTADAYRDPGEMRLHFLLENFGHGPAHCDWASLRTRSSGCLARDRDRLLAGAEAAGARQIACVDLGGPNLPIAVVKILVPGFLGHAQPATAAG